MKIFDGVELKPTLTPTMQGVISWALLLANTVIEAGRCRDERLDKEAGTGRPMTLDQVMEQSGLRIPGLAEAVEQLMGGTEEAKQAAHLLINNPDPAVLVQKFAEHFGLAIVAEPAAAATTTPPPTATRSATAPPPATPPSPAPAAPPVPPSPTASTVIRPPPFRQDFSRNTRAAEGVAAPAARLPAFRPDFTREAREAAKAATANPTAAVVHEQPPPSATTSASTHAGEPDVARPSLVGMVEQQLGALRRRMKAHQNELDARLKRAEAELAELRQELDELRAAKPESAPAIDPSTPVQDPADRPHGPSPTADAPVAGDSAAVVATEVAPEFAVELDMGPTPPAASEAEVIRAGQLLSEFAEEVEEHHQQSLARVVAVEREVSAARALVEHERGSEGAPAHG